MKSPQTPHEEMRELDKAGVAYVVTITFDNEARGINRVPVVSHSPNWLCVEIYPDGQLIADRWWIAMVNIQGIAIERA